MSGTYIIKRILVSIPILLGITLLSFTLMRLAPGNPMDMFVRPDVHQEDLEQLKKNLGLDKPVLVQYGIWLKNLAQGNFGYSYITGKPVLEEITERLPATLLLSVSALLLTLILTIPLGILSGIFQNSTLDKGIAGLSLLGMSLPTFWVGLMLILFLAVKLNLFPTSGYIDPILIDESPLRQITSIAYHMALPLLTIMIGSLAGLTRYLRSNMISVLKEPYIIAARARSIRPFKLYSIHALKNAALPVVTILGLSLPDLIGGAFVIEYIFSWPGMGQLGVSAVFARDYPVIMGILVFSSVLILAGNLLSDLLYTWIDPRIQSAESYK